MNGNPTRRGPGMALQVAEALPGDDRGMVGRAIAPATRGADADDAGDRRDRDRRAAEPLQSRPVLWGPGDPLGAGGVGGPAAALAAHHRAHPGAPRADAPAHRPLRTQGEEVPRPDDCAPGGCPPDRLCGAVLPHRAGALLQLAQRRRGDWPLCRRAAGAARRRWRSAPVNTLSTRCGRPGAAWACLATSKWTTSWSSTAAPLIRAAWAS